MAKLNRDVYLPHPPQHGFMLLQTAGNEIPKFRNTVTDTQNYQLCWSKGWGWTNPVDVKAIVFQAQDGTSHIQLEASIMALADPFGFLKRTLDQFETHLMNHHQAHLSGTPAPPPPKDNSGLIVNLVIIGVALLIAFLMVGFVAIAVMN